MKRPLTFLLVLIMATGLFAQEANHEYSFIKSIVLPGWGELSYQSNSSYVFLGIEAALWIGYAGLRYSGYVQNQDLINFARLNAGITDYPDDEEYWADLGDFVSYADHREDMLENRTPEDIWSTDYQWDWGTEEKLLEYEQLFRNKELTLLGSEFVITGMIVNRIASVINVGYLNKKNMSLSAFAAPVKGGGYLEVGLSF